LTESATRIGRIGATRHKRVASTVRVEVTHEGLDQMICVGLDGLSIDLQPGLRTAHAGQVPEA
jgi:hypothetical protein